MTVNAETSDLAATAASVEEWVDRPTPEGDADMYAREAAMWRSLYQESEQERLNLLEFVRGDQIP